MNANEDDVLLFTGSGVTGAIHKLVSAMNIIPQQTVSRFCLYFSNDILIVLGEMVICKLRFHSG